MNKPDTAARDKITQEMWKDLHLHILDHEDGKNDEKYLLTWSKRLPRFVSGCSCREHWRNWYATAANKPDFKTVDSYFAWSVKAHNSVNARNKKREWTVEEAKEYYTKLKASIKAVEKK